MSNTETPTPPSAGAVRAAKKIADLVEPNLLFILSEENRADLVAEVSEIIDRETRARELEQDKESMDWLEEFYATTSSASKGFQNFMADVCAYGYRKAIANARKEGRA